MSPDEEQRLLKSQERGGKANALLKSEIYQEAFREVERALIDKWKECPIRDVEGQTSLKMMHKLLSEVRGYIEQVAEDGKMAALTLDHERSIKEKAKRAFQVFSR